MVVVGVVDVVAAAAAAAATAALPAWASRCSGWQWPSYAGGDVERRRSSSRDSSGSGGRRQLMGNFIGLFPVGEKGVSRLSTLLCRTSFNTQSY